MKGGFVQSARTFWSERNPRERGMLAAAIAVVVLGLVWALLIDPAVSGRAELAQALPTLRQQAAEVRALTREAGTAARSNATPVAPVSRESLEASLARRGLKAEEISVAEGIVRVRFQGASFAGVVDWLTDQHRSARLAVAEAKVERGADAGASDSVNAAFTLRQQREGQAK